MVRVPVATDDLIGSGTEIVRDEDALSLARMLS